MLAGRSLLIGVALLVESKAKRREEEKRCTNALQRIKELRLVFMGRRTYLVATCVSSWDSSLIFNDAE